MIMEKDLIINDLKNINWNILHKFFPNFKIFLVGSVLYRRLPRDVDVVCIISDDIFEKKYGNIESWIKEGETGKWTDIKYKWSEDVIYFWKKFQSKLSFDLDFKIYPDFYNKTYYLNNKRYLITKT